MSIATDVLQRIDIDSGVNVNYRETTLWYDGSQVDDLKKDNDIFVKKDGIYYQKTIDDKTLLKINTISDLRNQNGYYEGQEISLLGYYVSGDKKPVTYKFTAVDYSNYIDNGGNIIKSSKGSWVLQTEAISILDFGARGDDSTDNTESFRKCIKYAYDRTLVNIGYRSPIKIYIPNGIYRVNNTIIDLALNVLNARFIFEGETQYGAVIRMTSSNVLFDNKQVFGFTLFKNLTFGSIGNIGKVFYLQGGGAGNVQSLYFEHCLFLDLNQIAEIVDSTMVSEVTFRSCKIIGGNSATVWFAFKNDQAVNWRFYDTEAESFSGVLFDFYEGTTISYYQGSIIPENGIVARVNSASNSNKFGINNSNLLTTYSCKFELRENSKLFISQNSDVDFLLIFYASIMGTYGQTTGSNTIEIKDKGTIIFDNCSNLEKLKIKHEINDSSSFQNPANIIFNNIYPPLATIEAGVCNNVTNSSGSPIYRFNGGDNPLSYRPFAKENKTDFLTIRRKYPSIDSNRTYSGVQNATFTQYANIQLPDIISISTGELVFEGAWQGGYGGVNIDYEIVIDSIVVETGTFDSWVGTKVNLIGAHKNLKGKNVIIRLKGYEGVFGVSIFVKYEI